MNRNNAGFTLIEFLVAIVILMIGMLGLLQAVNLALQQNMVTQLRNEAVGLGDQQMSRELAKPYDLVSTVTGSRSVDSGFRNYSVTRDGVNLTNSKQVHVQVHWTYKGHRYTHDVYGAVSKTTH